MSEKGVDWLDFSNDVYSHIEEYVIQQYGDKHEDQAQVYSAEECVRQISKYSARFGRNARPDQDELDLIKIAHYAQIAYIKLQEQKNAKK